MAAYDIVKDFVSRNWDNEKLVYVSDLNRAEKLNYNDRCCCILGIHTSREFHTTRDNVEHKFLFFKWRAPCNQKHYKIARKDPYLRLVEREYFLLDCHGPRNIVFQRLLDEVVSERARVEPFSIELSEEELVN